jgi:hypothetical protein
MMHGGEWVDKHGRSPDPEAVIRPIAALSAIRCATVPVVYRIKNLAAVRSRKAKLVVPFAISLRYS